MLLLHQLKKPIIGDQPLLKQHNDTLNAIGKLRVDQRKELNGIQMLLEQANPVSIDLEKCLNRRVACEPQQLQALSAYCKTIREGCADFKEMDQKIYKHIRELKISPDALRHLMREEERFYSRRSSRFN